MRLPAHAILSNGDLLAWGFYTYCLFYFGVSFGNWNLGAVGFIVTEPSLSW